MITSAAKIHAKEVSNFFKELEDFCLEQKSNKMVYFGLEEICDLSFSETYRSLLDFEFSNKVIRNLLLSHAESIEKYSPPSAAYLPYILSFLFKNKIKINHEEYFEEASAVSLGQVKQVINSYFKNSSLLKPEDYISFFEKNGFISSFSLKKSNSFQNACVFESGLTLLNKINSGFYKNSKIIELENPQVIIYDGYIQEVSEINRILSISNEKNIPFLLFCKGASIDVIHTCFVNFNMKKCEVIICEPLPSFWKDEKEKLCSAFSTIPYGFETGKLLSNYELEEDFTLRVRLNQNEVFMKSQNLDLKEKAKTTIYLNESSWDKRGIISDQVNFFNSTMQQLATCGVVSSDFIEKSIGANMEEISGLECEIHPAFPFFRALKEAENVLNKIVNIGYLIRLEK